MISAPAFIKQLQTNPSFTVKPIILLYGGEPLYIQLSLDQLRANLKQQSYLQRDKIDVDGNYKWQNLKSEVSAGSLFADKRIIEIHAPTAKFGREGGAFMQEWLQMSHDTPPEICIIIICEKIDFRQTKTKWFQAIQTKGLIVQSKPIEGQSLIQWCNNKARELSLVLEPDAAALLAQRVEGNLLAANQELEKLSLLFKGQTLNAQHIASNVADQAHYQLFALSSAMLNGKTTYALQILNRLRQSGIEQTIILWLLAKELRELINISQQQQTQTLPQIFKQLRIWNTKQIEYTVALRRHNLNYLQDLLAIALEADLNLKGIRQGFDKNNAWVDITDLVFKIARRSNNERN